MLPELWPFVHATEHIPPPAFVCRTDEAATEQELPSDLLREPDRFDELEALQATADFARRRGVSDSVMLAEYHLLYLEAIVRGLLDE